MTERNDSKLANFADDVMSSTGIGLLYRNPRATARWYNFGSAVSGKEGFSAPLLQFLNENRIRVDDTGITVGDKGYTSNQLGVAGERATEELLRRDGYKISSSQTLLSNGARRVLIVSYGSQKGRSACESIALICFR